MSIFGWGKRSEAVGVDMATELVQLMTKTATCLLNMQSYSWLEKWWRSTTGQTLVPQFLCLDALPAVGAPCPGDDGGKLKIPCYK